MEENVSVRSHGAVLAGTLLLPQMPPPFVGVILIHGSGDGIRADVVTEAQIFVEHGIAALIYDKRGSGASTGDWRNSDFLTLGGDVLALYAWLQNHPHISTVGIWALSEGAWIAPSVVTHCQPPPAFLITVSASGVNPAQVELYQRHQHWLRQHGSERGWRRHYIGLRLLFGVLPHIPKGLLPLSDSVRFFARTMTYDVLPYWNQIPCPVLTVWGGSDSAIPVEQSKKAISAELVKAPTPIHRTIVFPNASHTIRSIGAPQDHMTDPLLSTYAPGYPEQVALWAKNQP